MLSKETYRIAKMVSGDFQAQVKYPLRYKFAEFDQLGRRCGGCGWYPLDRNGEHRDRLFSSYDEAMDAIDCHKSYMLRLRTERTINDVVYESADRHNRSHVALAFLVILALILLGHLL